jgi:hypothetical protein
MRWNVRVMVVGAGPLADAVVAGLEGEGIDVARPAASEIRSGRDSELSALAAELLAFESLMAAEAPDAVVVAGDDDRSLAATVAATKVPIRVAFVGIERADEGLNARLIARMVDASLGGDVRSAAAWVQGLVPS